MLDLPAAVAHSQCKLCYCRFFWRFCLNLFLYFRISVYELFLGTHDIIDLKGTVIRATFFFNLSRSNVALQVETHCCAYYHVCDQLVQQQNTILLRQHVAQSRLEFYFLQQILVLLLVLPLKLQLVSQQI